jgi:glutamine amidotransferase
MIGIVEYGSGNIKAITNIYHRQGIPFFIADKPADVCRASKLILPGVGAFDHCMAALIKSGMKEALNEEVNVNKKPVLGICVGMQLMAKDSEEGKLDGLGWIDATVKKFDETKFNQATHLPHMGWNVIEPSHSDVLFKQVDLQTGYYFLHSYYFSCNNMSDVLAVANYGGRFACAIKHENIYGVQFHPEKSHLPGVQLLENFAKI